jgi:hypothetical protein
MPDLQQQIDEYAKMMAASGGTTSPFGSPGQTGRPLATLNRGMQNPANPFLGPLYQPQSDRGLRGLLGG